MSSFEFTSFAATLCIITTLASGLSVQAAQLRNDPNRPTDKISDDLQITEKQFVDCFWNVRPEQNGNPSAAQQRQNKAVLLPCLQQANAEITNQMLDTVMDRYRPEGPNGRN